MTTKSNGNICDKCGKPLKVEVTKKMWVDGEEPITGCCHGNCKGDAAWSVGEAIHNEWADADRGGAYADKELSPIAARHIREHEYAVIADTMKANEFWEKLMAVKRRDSTKHLTTMTDAAHAVVEKYKEYTGETHVPENVTEDQVLETIPSLEAALKRDTNP